MADELNIVLIVQRASNSSSSSTPLTSSSTTGLTVSMIPFTNSSSSVSPRSSSSTSSVSSSSITGISRQRGRTDLPITSPDVNSNYDLEAGDTSTLVSGKVKGGRKPRFGAARNGRCRLDRLIIGVMITAFVVSVLCYIWFSVRMATPIPDNQTANQQQ